MSAEDFLTINGVSVDWLENCCDEILRGDTDDADGVICLLTDMIRAGVPLPNNAAGLTAKILQDVADGKDARELVGTRPKRGAPNNEAVAEKHRQAVACVELLKLAEIHVTKAVELVGLSTPIDSREIWKLPTEEPVGDWNAIPYFAEIGFGSDGDGVLRRLINLNPSDPGLRACWDKFSEFCTVNRIS